MKRFIIWTVLFLTMFGTSLSTFAQEQSKQVELAVQYKKIVMQEKRQRVTIYNALNLSQEQIEKKECLLSENDKLLQNKFDELFNEVYKLNVLENANANECDILKQKKIINNIKKDIKCITKKEDKQFKKILNHDQKSKYSMIKKLERLDCKRENSQKDYYKSNPGLVPFGNI